MASGRPAGTARWRVCAALAAAVTIASVTTPRVAEPDFRRGSTASMVTLSAAAVPVDALDDAALVPGSADTLGDGLLGAYNAIEPWAQWLAESAVWLLRWVPLVGLLAPQITIFYDFGESVARSVVSNGAELLDGTIDLNTALSNINTATGQAFDALYEAQQNWINGLVPPLPPLFPPPPIDVSSGGAGTSQPGDTGESSGSGDTAGPESHPDPDAIGADPGDAEALADGTGHDLLV